VAHEMVTHRLDEVGQLRDQRPVRDGGKDLHPK
jgi:hypothetical protein